MTLLHPKEVLPGDPAEALIEEARRRKRRRRWRTTALLATALFVVVVYLETTSGSGTQRPESRLGVQHLQKGNGVGSRSKKGPWTSLVSFPVSGVGDALDCPTPRVCISVGPDAEPGSNQGASLDSVVLTSNDGGNTWTRHPSSALMNQADALSCPTVSTCFAAIGNPGTETGGILATHDGGLTWTVEPTPSVGELGSISCPNSHECIAVGYASPPSQPDAVMTTDGGRSWRAFDVRSGGATAVSCADDLHCVVLSSEGGTSIWYADYTKNGGETWSSSTLPSFPGSVGIGQSSYHSISCPSSSDCVAAGDTGSHQSAVAFTTDGGRSWSPSLSSSYFRSIVYVTCPSLDRCYGVAVGEPYGQGTLITATGPAGGWHELKGTPFVAGSTPMLSCPTDGQCVSFEEDSNGSPLCLTRDRRWLAKRQERAACPGPQFAPRRDMSNSPLVCSPRGLGRPCRFGGNDRRGKRMDSVRASLGVRLLDGRQWRDLMPCARSLCRGEHRLQRPNARLDQISKRNLDRGCGRGP